MDEDSVRAALERAAAAPAPPARVDIAAARRRGRGALRRRAGLTGGSAVAAVAAVAVAVTGAGPFGSHPGRPAAPGRHAGIAPPRRFSPLTTYASFGWLPPGESLGGGQMSPVMEYLTAGPHGTAAWSLTVYTAGRCQPGIRRLARQIRRHRQASLVCAFGRSGGWTGPISGFAPRVGRSTAFWTAQHGSLAWQFARDSWAVLSLPRGRAARSEAVAIARRVRYGAVAARPVEFPVQLTGMPAASAVGYTYFVADAGRLRASEYSLAEPRPYPPGFTTNLTKRRDTCDMYPDGQSRRETINGYRVVVDRLRAERGNPAVRQVCATDVAGLFIFVSTYGRTRPDAVSLFAHHLRVLGPDPANWTTRPLS